MCCLAGSLSCRSINNLENVVWMLNKPKCSLNENKLKRGGTKWTNTADLFVIVKADLSLTLSSLKGL